jgi:type II secretory ATPase GspE/PulE/Tfp pilus assembly ATPase PilB-like protein
MATHSAPRPAVSDGEASISQPNRPGKSIQVNLGEKEPDESVPFLVEHATELHASDLFIDTDEDRVSVSVRHLGMLRPVCDLPLDLGRRCISYVKAVANINISDHRRPADGRWLFTRPNGQRVDLRISTIPSLYGEDCAIRILDPAYRLLSLDQLGFSTPLYNTLIDMLAHPTGLILVTGPTEVGKSTTLYASLAYLNNGERRINTIEDPIEYSLAGIRQSAVNMRMDVDFDGLLRTVLRQAPHVIMIGEIRDGETALTAVRAAASGVMVLSTLHAPVATTAVHALLRLEVYPHLLSYSLLGVMSQRLLRTLCPYCKTPFELPSEHVFDDIRESLGPGEGQRVFAAQGCAACQMTGYSGLTAIFEMLRVSNEIRRLIDERAPTPVLRAQALQEGMVELRHSALLKVAQGVTTFEEVMRVLPAEYLV